MGETCRKLCETATRLSREGRYVDDPNELINVVLQDADPFNETVKRFQTGALGPGWPDVTEHSLEELPDGRLKVALGGRVRIFAPLRNGDYGSTAGDGARISPPAQRQPRDGDVDQWQLDEPGGGKCLFGASGQLAGVEDAYGNRTDVIRDGQGRVTELRDARSGCGAFTVRVSPVVNSWVSHEDRFGRKTMFGYAPDGSLNSVRNSRRAHRSI